MTREEMAKRDERSEDLQVCKLNEREYFVESSKGKICYKVILNNGNKSCTCGDFASNIQENPDFVCKHILAVVNGNGNVKCLNNQKTKPKLDDRWITSIKGKDFVVYSGLLDLSHQIGLDSIKVEVVQLPTKDNANEAICKAVTYSNDGQVFVDFGDANPNNVNSLVQNHLLRVAATRAKARTLRDMTNIGMTCLEELGGDEEVETSEQTNKTQRSSNAKTKQKTKQQSTKSKSEQPVKQTEQSKQSKQQSEQPVKQTEQSKQSKQQTEEENTKAKNKDNNGEMNNKPSSAQMNAIKNLASRRGLSESAMDELAKEKLNIPSFNELTSDHAAKFIKILQQSA